MVQAAISKFPEPHPCECSGGGNEVGVQARRGGGFSNLFKIRPQQGFAAGQVQLQDARISRLPHDVESDFRWKICGRLFQLLRVRAVRLAHAVTTPLSARSRSSTKT